MADRPKPVELFGLRIDPLRMSGALDLCRSRLASRDKLLIGVLNAAKVVKLRSDADLRESLLECDILLADGQSVVWASRILRRPLPERVAGIDLFDNLLQMAADEGARVFLLGAKADVLTALEHTLRKRFPELVIAGSRHGYFADADAAEVATQITQSKADMLFLGMASPKKEIFLGRFGDDLGVPILHGVGGSFDVMAGITKRAPRVWQRFGMEWAYRLLQEPRRMFRRYATTNTMFIGLVLGEAFHRTPTYVTRSTDTSLTGPDQPAGRMNLDPPSIPGAHHG